MPPSRLLPNYRAPFRPFIKINSNTDPWGPKCNILVTLKYDLLGCTRVLPGAALTQSKPEPASLPAACLQLPGTIKPRGMDGSQRSLLHMHHILPVLAVSRRNEACERETNGA